MFKKALFPLAVAMGVVLAPAAAWANDCVNLSRGTGGPKTVPWETTRGRWWFIVPDVGPLWAFGTPDNFRNGKAGALLEGTGACSASRLLGQTKGEVDFDTLIDDLNGIWSQQCVNDALLDAGVAG